MNYKKYLKIVKSYGWWLKKKNEKYEQWTNGELTRTIQIGLSFNANIAEEVIEVAKRNKKEISYAGKRKNKENRRWVEI